MFLNVLHLLYCNVIKYSCVKQFTYFEFGVVIGSVQMAVSSLLLQMKGISKNYAVFLIGYIQLFHKYIFIFLHNIADVLTFTT